MGAYLAGTDRINIHHEANEVREIKKIIRDFQRFTRGFEVEDESDSQHTLICLLNASEMPLRSSLNQMFLRLNSIVRDVLDVLCGGDIQLISDYEEREREIDSQHFLIERQAGIILDSYKVAESLGMTRRQAVEHANLARCLERMADHAFQLADMATKFGGVLSFNSENLPLNQIPIWQEAIRGLMINMRTKDAREIETARNALKSAQLSLKGHEEGLWSGKREAKKVLLEDHISESIRRMCAYARDFGETLLNMIAHEETITTREQD
jgi:phosphate uptake regulator